MAGLLSGWLGENPFYQGFDQRRNAISQFGLGLMSGTTPQEGFQRGVVGAIEGRQQDDAYATAKKAEADRQKAINATTEWLRGKAASDPFAADMVGLVEAGALTPNAAFSEYTRMAQGGTSDWSRLNDGTLYNQRTGEVMNVGGAGGQTSYSTQTIPGYDADGNFVLMQAGSDGTGTVTQFPEGVRPADPFALNSQRAAGTVDGRTQGTAAAALPSAQVAVQQAKDTIASIRNNKQGWDEQFGKVLGVWPQQMAPVVPGTARANLLVDIDQINGQAFIQAREWLKGQGQITDFESRRAEAAFSRVQSAIEKGDRASFEAALTDFEAALDAGLAKVAAQARGTQAGATDYRNKYGLE